MSRGMTAFCSTTTLRMFNQKNAGRLLRHSHLSKNVRTATLPVKLHERNEGWSRHRAHGHCDSMSIHAFAPEVFDAWQHTDTGCDVSTVSHRRVEGCPALHSNRGSTRQSRSQQLRYSTGPLGTSWTPVPPVLSNSPIPDHCLLRVGA